MRILVRVHSVGSPGSLAGLREENALLAGALDERGRCGSLS